MGFPWMAAATAFGGAGQIWAGNKQNKFARNSFRNRLREAEKFGIHPLAAIGSAGTAMGDGGFGTMASGFSQAAKAAAIAREDELMERDLFKSMWMASNDPTVRRNLEERMLGEGNFITPLPTPTPSKPTTITGTVNEIGQAVNEIPENSMVQALANELGVAYNVAYQYAKEVLERGINWHHTR